MTVAAKKIVKQALALSESERAKVVSELLKSLSEEAETLSQEEWDEAWEVELKKRLEEIESGKVKCIPYEVVRKELDVILGKS
jgi:putative addiction module component (TIGR02574 family)